MTACFGARRWTSALLLSFAAGVATGQPLPVGDELAVDENSQGAQNGGGGEAADESGEIFLRRYEADATPGAPAPIHPVTPLPQTSPSIDVRGDGEAVDLDLADFAGWSSVVAPDALLLLLCD